MPALHRYPRRLVPGYFPLQQLSLELILEIFAWCAPLDLVILRSLSRHVKAILDQHGHRCWTRARNNLLCLPAVPPLPNSKYSETAFINYFFNSGCNKCCSCGRSVDNAFPNLTYMIYLCTNAGCYKHFTSKQQRFLFSFNEQDLSCRKYEPILTLLYCDPHPEKKLYLTKQAKKELAWYEDLLKNKDKLHEMMAKKRRTRHILGQHANKMRKWAIQYDREFIVVNKKNRVFLRTVTHSKRLKYLDILCTPTVRRTLEDFNRRLTCLTLTVWRDIMTQVVQEYHQLRARETAAGQ
ncbi:hypothetical protein ARMSODRAFT_1019952 [Armillaria solidipes]|uniref:F-box domain-containing protein n=1 Tax=Armillaria solidipes TaxID=1076256 RepID=A0A2H3BE05_9AGAR|nr:hypothetical protein ARMSODRAFT_1019952 [Armillaria solidipes]